MLQYFLDKRHPSAFVRGVVPRLEYICNVDAESSKMPRSMHEHEHITEVLLVYQGMGIFIVGGERVTAKAGDMVVYNTHTAHDEFGATGVDIYTYCVGVSNLQLKDLPPGALVSDSVTPAISTGDAYGSYLSLMQSIERNLKESDGGEAAELMAQALFSRLYFLFKEKGREKEKGAPSISQLARLYIDKHYKEENIRLATIAEAVRVSSYYLAHVFKKEIGLSPMKYVALRRLGEAQNLLINTSKSITEIAASVGYNNSNYFQNAFRTAMSMTPGEYRKKWVK